AEAREHVGDGVAADRDAEQPLDAGAAQAHGVAPRKFRWARHVGQRSRAAAADLDDELRRALHRAGAAAEVDAALEAVARVARESEAAHLALDHGGTPERALEVDARGVVG